ncbi:extracellular solute-binding protein [Pseudodesulfovibrio sp.]|uniref:extracellular solute-binding protein n=1 Tax=Pseudodesulfovibrio sp. TaxID=2035812 RepID=UPI00262C0D30|nr:extracellular solute-binding protein [Pseudodesulfovibrio sp.]MDD3311706.1 extracellular solute-binding protein [Pseudodesulfovibrio sp.]
MQTPVRLLLMLCLLGLACGCGPEDGAEAEKGSVLLRVRIWDARPTGATPAVLQRICDAFTQANPSIRVRLESLPQQEYKERIFLDAASGEAPDVFMTWPAGFLEGFVRNGSVLALDDALADDPAWRGRFHPGVFDDLTIDGRIYAVPNTTAVAALFYNKRILGELGLSPPETLAGLRAMIPALRRAGYVPVAFGNQEPWNGGLLAALLIERVGGMAPYRALERNNGDWSRPAFARAGALLRGLAEAGAFPDGFNDLSYQGAVELFRDGGAAMAVMGSWAVPACLQSPVILRDGLGVAPFPLAESGAGSTHAWLGQTDLNLAVNAGSAHRDAALKLLKWFSEPFEQRRLMEATGNLVVAGIGDDASVLPAVTRDLMRLLAGRRESFLFYDVRFGRGAGEAFNDTVKSILSGVDPAQAFAELESAILHGRISPPPR